jgi:LysR family transcriptional activator of nhaA
MNAAIGIPDGSAKLAGLNLNHLLYFWAVGRTGSVTKAARAMRVAQPTISEQVRRLEDRLGAVLLERSRRGVRLTAAGDRVMRYAEEVVGICTELTAAIPLRRYAEPRAFTLGAADAVPKVIVRSVIEHCWRKDPSVRVLCREWRIDHLLAELTLHRLDAVLADAPVEHDQTPRLTSHLAGSSMVGVAATPALARRLRKGFPRSLAGAPIGLPAPGSYLRGILDRWFEQHRIRPRIALEAEDRSNLHYFAQSGHGVIPFAMSTAAVLLPSFGLSQVGRLPGLREEYFIVMVDRPRQHPAASALRADLAAGPILPTDRGTTARSRRRTGS